MRKFKKIALLCALLMIAAIGTTAGANAGERSVAKTAVSAEGTESIADTNLTIADSTSFDGVRVSITGQVESDAADYAYARRTVLYAGIGEGDRDLSEAESISVKLKFVTANSNRIFVVLADGTGNTAVSKFYVTRPKDGKPLGSKFYNESGVEVSLTEASGSAWEGVAVKNTGTAGTLVCAKDGFYTAESMWSDNAANAQNNKNEYGIADKTVTPSGTFDWSDVRRVMVSVVVWNVNTLDIGDISAEYADGGKKTLFDASESERKTAAEISALGKDEWAFAPRLNYIEAWQNDKGGVFENLGKEKATIVAANVEENGYVFVRTSAAVASDIWKMTAMESGQDYGDITGYNAFVFDLDSRMLTQEGKIDFILRVKEGTNPQKDYRAYGNGNSTENYFHYIAENGEYTTNFDRKKGGNIIPTGFNGKVIIPFNAFQGATESERPIETELKNTVALLMVFNAANFKASETVNIGKIKLVADFEKKITEYRAAAQKSAVSEAVTTFCESFAMTDGAALRVKKGDYGLRFMVNLSANAYAALKTAAEKAGVSIELGAILASDDSLNGLALTKDNKEMSLIVGKWNKENENFFATLGYDKIQGKEGVNYTVRGYLTLTFADGSSQTVYTEYSLPENGEKKAGGAISRSLKQVAEAVSLNENFEKEFADKSDAGKAYAREVLEQILGAANA